MRRETASACVFPGFHVWPNAEAFLYLHREMEDKDGIFQGNGRRDSGKGI